MLIVFIPVPPTDKEDEVPWDDVITSDITIENQLNDDNNESDWNTYKEGKDFIDTVTLTHKLRISRDEHLLYLEKNIIGLEERMEQYLKDGNFSNAENMYNCINLNKDSIRRANDFWEFLNKNNK